MVDGGFANILDKEAYDSFAERQYEPISVVETYWPTLNHECRGDGGGKGLAFGWHVIIAGATNMGKSMFALNLAANAATLGHKVAFISLEMARHQIQQRVYAIISGESGDTFSRGNFGPKSEQVMEDMGKELEFVAGFPPVLLVNEKPIRNIHDIISQLDWFHDAWKCRVFVVDYLQLCHTGNEEDMRRQVTEISATLMGYAHEKDVLTIGLSQMNRLTTKDKSLPPQVEGMIGSSSLENDADMVLVLDHSKYQKDKLSPWIHRTWVRIGKNRHGGKGSIPIEWDWRNFRCREATPDEESIWP